MGYVSDSGLTTRIPATATASLAERTIALDDAAAEIDVPSYLGSAERAHALLAAHYLATGGFIAGAVGAGAVTSRSIGGLTVAYASGGTSASGPHASTAYGRAFDEISDRVLHAPVSG